MPYNPRPSARDQSPSDDLITSDLITVDERQLRTRMALEQVRFFENLEKTVSDPEWAGKDHPFVKRQGQTDFEIGFRLKIKAERGALTKELAMLNKALENDLNLQDEDDDD